MATVARSSREELVARILAAGRAQAEGAEKGAFGAFLEAYLESVWLEDLETHGAGYMAQAALGQWRWGRKREKKAALSRVFSASAATHDESVPVTVVEVVTPDMPFLVASLNIAVHEAGCAIHWMSHPIIEAREENGSPRAGGLESWVHMEVDPLPDKGAVRSLGKHVSKMLIELEVVVGDWQPMRECLSSVAGELEQLPAGFKKTPAREARDFLHWLDDNHFTLLGYARHTVETDERGRGTLNKVANSGLGLMRESLQRRGGEGFTAPSSIIDKYARSKRVLVITKASQRSIIHHPRYMDIIAVKRFDERGEVVGAHRFLGLFAAEGYAASPRNIPVLRRKVGHVIERAGLRRGGHASKNLASILETFPRDELFQSSEKELYATVMGILSLHDREQLRLFVRRDRYGRFYSCLLYLPRDQYSGEVRRRLAAELMQYFSGKELEHEVEFIRRSMARIRFIVRTEPGSRVQVDKGALEARLLEITRGWRDRFHAALFSARDKAEAAQLWSRFSDAFPPAYKEKESPQEAVRDAVPMARLSEREPLGLSLTVSEAQGLTLRLYALEGAVALSDILPTLERFGLRVVEEQPYEIQGVHQSDTWLQVLAVSHLRGGECSREPLRELFEEAFLKVRAGAIEDDGLNALVLGAGLAWRRIQLLRALSRYLVQTGIPYSFSYMRSLLVAHPGLAGQLVALFEARFDPKRGARARKRQERELDEKIDAALEQVASLDADRVLRGLASVIRACLRANYYRKGEDGAPRPFISFKLRCADVLELPEPRPLFEAFVFSPEVEGVHLRAGKVSRGGLRWSDRREDFRTEVLGLMKAQQVKNAIIVPVGAKGGFYVKRYPEGVARQEQGKHCYRTYIRGLLDVTDNLAGDRVVPPPDVVRHDEADTYLVVAADKGTASFSDVANEIAAEYDYWLGDAFASGGSHGYDHKEMGITARGAWESVRRHFAEMGLDTQSDPFTVVGIGDMGGDVFGNGMLLSRKIKLVAAFNHRHIFIDPDPDPEVGFKERRRLFKRPRLAWSDYDPAALSEGGGVFERSAKRVELSEQARRALAIDKASATPNEVISAILAAPVDLLWNGGIGTYVKASDESHADVGDRANDGLRVDARELRCRVVGEGGNLGLTQRARVEYARGGGRLNADFIDNAGGVSSSDLEVNIKIPLNELMQGGKLTQATRDELLGEMQRDVATKVLEENRDQGRILSLLERVTAARLDEQSHLIRQLERQGLLDRDLENLPDEETLNDRRSAGEGLTRPELAVLLAYSKIALYDALGESDLPDDAYFEKFVLDYFPPAMRESYRDAVLSHRLRRQLVATRLTNEFVDRMGIAFPHRMALDFGVGVERVAWGYVVAAELFDANGWWHALENARKVSLDVRYGLYEQVMGLLKQATLWLMQIRQRFTLSGAVSRYQEHVNEIVAAFPKVLHGSYRSQWEARRGELCADGVSAALARRLAGIPMLRSVLDIAELTRRTSHEPGRVASVYFALGERLYVPWIQDAVWHLEPPGRWEALARAELRQDTARMHALLTRRVLAKDGDGEPPPRKLITKWEQGGNGRVAFSLNRLEEMHTAQLNSFPTLSAAVAELRAMAW